MDIQKAKKDIRKIITKEKKEKEGQVGELVKLKRLEYNHTQQSLSNGICSVSQLSKIENNVVQPHMLFIREIADKLDMQLAHYYQFSKDKNFVQLLSKIHYYDDLDTLKELHDILEPFKDTNVYLFHKVIVNLKEKAYDEATKNLSELQKTLKAMNHDSAKLFGVLAAECFFHQSKHHEAVTLLTSLSHLSTAIGEITTLEHIYQYLTKQMISYQGSSVAHYQMIETLLKSYPHSLYCVLLPLYKAYFTGLEVPELAIEMIDKMHPNQYPKRYQNLFGLTKLLAYSTQNAHHMMQHGYEILEPTMYDSWLYQAVRTYEKYAKEHNLVFENPINYNAIPNELVLEKIDYDITLIENEQEKYTYIKEIALPLAVKKQSQYYINSFSHLMAEHAQNHARYKEAMLIYRKKDKILKKFQTIL